MIVNELILDQLVKAAEMLKAMAHPMRITLLNYLEDGQKRTVTDIHKKLCIEQSATSHHLGIVKNKGVLVATCKGKNSLYSIRNKKISTLIDCINSCAYD
jgi:DNA-binding transcriptional ArsR family regulator